MKYVSAIYLFLFFPTNFADAETLSFQGLVSYWQQNNVTSATEAIETLPTELNSQFVQLHTSRSLHRANADFPRRIYFANKDASDKSSGLFLASSSRPAAEPVLEVIDYDFDAKTVDFYAMGWDEQGRLRIQRNPRMCFNCHGGGRALWPGLSRDAFWPGAFTGSDFDENNTKIEKTLSSFNAEFQAHRLVQHPEFLRYRQALLNFTSPTPQSEKKFLTASFLKDFSNRMSLFVADSHNIFLQTVAWPERGPRRNPQTDHLDRITNLALNLHAMGNLDFIDNLSLNLRPENFELSEATLQTLHRVFSETSPPKGAWEHCRQLLKRP